MRGKKEEEVSEILFSDDDPMCDEQLPDPERPLPAAIDGSIAAFSVATQTAGRARAC